MDRDDDNDTTCQLVLFLFVFLRVLLLPDMVVLPACPYNFDTYIVCLLGLQVLSVTPLLFT